MRITRRLKAALTGVLLLGMTAASLVGVSAANAADESSVVLNEIESNGDPVNDWVELYNTGESAVDVSGWIIKDDNNSRILAVAAGTVIGPGEFFAMYVDGVPNGFGLGGADTARLFLPDGTTLVDSYAWTSHAATTYGRCPDGTGEWVTTESPTMGAANDCPAPANASSVVLNEIESNGDPVADWVELYNTGGTAVNVGGWIIKDDNDSRILAIAAGTMIEPGGFFAMYVDGVPNGFGLGGNDMARLFLPDGTTLIDSHSWPSHASATYGRCLDGTGEWVTTASPTMGAANDCPAPANAPSVAWDTRIAGGVGNALSGVLGADTNPVASGTIEDPLLGTDPFVTEDYTIEAISEDETVVTDDDISIVVADDGSFLLSAEPTGAGRTTIAVTVTSDDARTSTSRLNYWVSAAMTDETAFAHVGLSDASAGYDVGDGYFLVADDDSNQIRLFGPGFGEAVAEFDFTAEIGGDHPTDNTFDIEGAARIDDTIYWVGSLGNTRSGNIRLQRDVVLATEVNGSGAGTTLDYVGVENGFREALVEWDESDAHGQGAGAFEFARATGNGYTAEGPNSLNLEGATIAPDGETLWLGFRSPLVPVGDNGSPGSEGDLALIIAIDDIESVVTGGAEIEVADYFTLDLDGRAIRDLVETDDGNYLIAAGSADDAGDFAIFGWSGDPSEAPVVSQNPLSLSGWAGSYETILGAGSLSDGTVIRVLQDVGTIDIYGTGTEAQDLTREYMKFPSHEYVLDFDGAFASDGGGSGEGGSGDGGGSESGGGTPPAPAESALTPELRGGISAPGSVEQGVLFTVRVGTSYAGQAVDAWIFSTPTYLGRHTVNAQGNITVSVPLSVATGAHRIVVTNTSGAVIGWQSITVTQGQLSNTGLAAGATIPFAGLAAILLFAGLAAGAAALVARRSEG